MFEISWSEVLILAVVTLIFVGPKDLPKFLNALGRYAGMVRRQASEFRAQFDEAMREAELDALKKEVDTVRSDIAGSLRGVETEPPGITAPVQPKLPLGRTAEELMSAATKSNAATGEAPIAAVEAGSAAAGVSPAPAAADVPPTDPAKGA